MNNRHFNRKIQKLNHDSWVSSLQLTISDWVVRWINQQVPGNINICYRSLNILLISWTFLNAAATKIILIIWNEAGDTLATKIKKNREQQEPPNNQNQPIE